MKSDICDVYYEQYDIDLFVNTKHGDRINKSKIGNNFRQREIRSILKKLISINFILIANQCPVGRNSHKTNKHKRIQLPFFSPQTIHFDSCLLQ